MELTSVHWQEYLERMKIAQKDVANLITDHAVYQNDSDIKFFADKVVEAVYDLQMRVGIKKMEMMR